MSSVRAAQFSYEGTGTRFSTKSGSVRILKRVNYVVVQPGSFNSTQKARPAETAVKRTSLSSLVFSYRY
jgi:hypothetical protein